VDSFLLRYSDELETTTNSAQENSRLEVPQEFLRETLRCMNDAVQDCLRDLVLDLDEVGVSDWEDRKSKQVVVSAAFNDQTIHHGINRNLKHITIVTYVISSGEYLMPYIVTSQDFSALRLELQKRGIEFHKHLEIVPSQKLYANGKTFASYIETVFLPHVAKVRGERKIEEEEAALLMDNSTLHFIYNLLISLLKTRTSQNI
jgi:hypothetical protein